MTADNSALADHEHVYSLRPPDSRLAPGRCTFPGCTRTYRRQRAEEMLADALDAMEHARAAEAGRVPVSRDDLRAFFERLGERPMFLPASDAGKAERRLRDAAAGRTP